MATTKLGLETVLNGIFRMRQNIVAAMNAFDDAAAPAVVVEAATPITITAANFNGAGKGLLITTLGTAVAAGFAKAVSDLLPIGAELLVSQGVGAVTITGSGGLTVTARGVVAGGRQARAVKISATLWHIDYPALSA